MGKLSVSKPPQEDWIPPGECQLGSRLFVHLTSSILDPPFSPSLLTLNTERVHF